MSTIKINRALATAKLGRNPGAAQDMLAAIPPAIIAALSSRQLAQMIDANWALTQASKALANAEAIDQGAVWDAQAQRLREIAA